LTDNNGRWMTGDNSSPSQSISSQRNKKNPTLPMGVSDTLNGQVHSTRNIFIYSVTLVYYIITFH